MLGSTYITLLSLLKACLCPPSSLQIQRCLSRGMLWTLVLQLPPPMTVCTDVPENTKCDVPIIHIALAFHIFIIITVIINVNLFRIVSLGQFSQVFICGGASVHTNTFP